MIHMQIMGTVGRYDEMLIQGDGPSRANQISTAGQKFRLSEKVVGRGVANRILFPSGSECTP